MFNKVTYRDSEWYDYSDLIGGMPSRLLSKLDDEALNLFHYDPMSKRVLVPAHIVESFLSVHAEDFLPVFRMRMDGYLGGDVVEFDFRARTYKDAEIKARLVAPCSKFRLKSVEEVLYW